MKQPATHVTRPASPIVFGWDAESTKIAPMKIQVLRGETILLAARILHVGRAAVLPKKSTVEVWWKPVKATDFWGPNPGKASDGGVITALFTPAMDDGSPAYDFFLRAKSPAGILYRAHGIIEVWTSPGAIPSEVQFPPKTLDFSKILVEHPELAPWLPLSHDTDPEAHPILQGKIGGMIAKLKKQIRAALTGAEGYVAQATQAAQQAEASANAASQSALEADGSASSAANSAAEATSSAQDASGYMTGAQSYSNSAQQYSNAAQQYATNAQLAAGELAAFQLAVQSIPFTAGEKRNMDKINQLLDALIGALKGD